MIKFINIDLHKIPYMSNILSKFASEVREKKTRIEARFYENYTDENTPGIVLSEEERKSAELKIKAFSRTKFKELFEKDRNALVELVNSQGWQVMKKYAEGMSFDVGEGSLIERLAIRQAKEQTANAIFSIPETIINFYDLENEENK